jgi:hypothetical protein
MPEPDSIAPEFHIETTPREMEAAIHAAVSALAKERGIEVKKTRLELATPHPAGVDFRVTCEVKAMLMSASFTVAGKAEIGTDLVAVVKTLDFSGEGMMASMAKGFAEPQLDKIRGKRYSLAQVNLPGLRVESVQVQAAERIRLTVRLGRVAG